MRGWLAFAMVLVLLLSGCVAKSSTSTSATTPATTHSTTASTLAAAANTTKAVNHAPSAGLVAKTGNGTAALNVTFLLTGADVDGDHLNWTLAFGDKNSTKGSFLPTNATHHYAVGGLFNATLSVTDGTNTTFAKVLVNITGLAKAVQTATGKWSYSSNDCPGASSTTAPATVYFPPPFKGINYDTATVDHGTVGHAFSASFVPAGVSGSVLFADSSGKILLRSNPAAGTVAGTIPVGAATAYFFSCFGEISNTTSVTVGYSGF